MLLTRTPLALAAALGLSVSLGACATSTPYQSAEVAGQEFGYSSEMLGADRYRVSFSGNEATSRETVENYLLYRAAELTRQKGYDGFYIVRNETQADVDIDTVPTAYPGWGPTWNYYGAGVGWNTFDPYLGTAFPLQRVTASDQYSASAVIEMYRGQPPMGADNPISASAVMARLGDNVQMPEA
ncbi:CC0125/CC1285 family lipoprotein [Erythrobacter sanguineus]|uniref:DUF4136 domain-containing protein n=1 Tax=Erythrobacter sanguineus TaxID=198312 RepID=A0A1M7SIG4_9SPHN|nr:hypothetical protein [Erythrobacter sanguineus]SHN58269.1 hypothetical protein SAMN02745193_01789 [Erythrobacter sanguineus]